MWESIVLLIASFMFIVIVLVDVGVSSLAHSIFHVNSASACRCCCPLIAHRIFHVNSASVSICGGSVFLLIASFIFILVVFVDVRVSQLS